MESRTFSVENVDALLSGWRESFSSLYSQESHSRFPVNMFLAIEFVIWLMTNVSELSSRQAAVEFAGNLVAAGRLRMIHPGMHFEILFSGTVREPSTALH